MKKVIEIGLTVLVVVLASACCACAPEREPEGFSIPKADIIYQALNNQLGAPGGGMAESNNLIGFVNADGTGNTLIRLGRRAYRPVFSLEAGGLFFHENVVEDPNLLGGGGSTYFLSGSGIYTYCDSLYDEGFVFPVRGAGYLLESDGGNIDLVDMKTCKVIKRLVEIPNEAPWVKSVDSAYPSSFGKSIIFTETYRLPWHHVIYIMDIETEAVREVLQGGYNASFSPNDQRIAYVGDNGIYIANADGTGSKLVVRIDFSSYSPYANNIEIPYPFWSSDGTTLVYHKCNTEDCQDLSDFSIYKVDVNSGVEQKIVDGGLYPVWIR